MADHFEEVTFLRISALEARVHDEAAAVNEHFLEQQQFITFSLNRQTVTLREERRAALEQFESRLNTRMDRLETRMDHLETRMDHLEARMDQLETRMDQLETRMDQLETRMDQLETKFEKLELKLDVQHAATQSLLIEIARRLPA